MLFILSDYKQIKLKSRCWYYGFHPRVGQQVDTNISDRPSYLLQVQSRKKLVATSWYPPTSRPTTQEAT
jgi:hypothetical protein